jgi:hypothetical protein
MGTRHQRVRQNPQISLNLLGEYMSSSFVRKQSILREAKYPKDFVGPQYDPAQRAAASYLAAGGGDQAQLRADLDAKLTGSERSRWFKQRELLCQQATACIIKLESELKLDSVDVALGCDMSHRMPIAGVMVTVIPDLIVRGVNRKGPFIGAMKFRYVKSKQLSEKWAAYSATLLHQFTETHLCGDETHAERRHCRFVDVFAGQIFEAPERYKDLRKDVEAACGQIRELWKSVGANAAGSGD